MTGGIDRQRHEPRIGSDPDAAPVVPDNALVANDEALAEAARELVRQRLNGLNARGPSAAAARAAVEEMSAPRLDWRALSGSWPLLLSGLPALLTLIALAFSLFPWLEPTPPPEVRSVTVTDLTLGERNKDLGDGRIANAVYFEIEAVGYDAEDIAVDWLVFDAISRERLDEQIDPIRWGVIDIGTRSDRVVGEIEVPPPSNHAGCIFVRVLLRPHVVGGGTSELPPTRLLLDVAETAPFDPFDATNATCPEPVVATGEPA